MTLFVNALILFQITMATNADCVNSQAIAVTKLLVPSLADNLLMMVVSSFLNGMSLRYMNVSSISHCGIRDPQPSSGHVNVHSLVWLLYLILVMRAYPSYFTALTAWCDEDTNC